MQDLITPPAEELAAINARIAELESLARKMLRSFSRQRGTFHSTVAEGQIGRWWAVLDGDR